MLATQAYIHWSVNCKVLTPPNGYDLMGRIRPQSAGGLVVYSLSSSTQQNSFFQFVVCVCEGEKERGRRRPADHLCCNNVLSINVACLISVFIKAAYDSAVHAVVYWAYQFIFHPTCPTHALSISDNTVGCSTEVKFNNNTADASLFNELQ